MKRLHRREKGFTLIELLIVVAILGILAAVIVPNLAGFITTGNVAAANTEVANVETAALAYYADNDGNWPDNASALSPDYLDDVPEYDYGFNDYGKVTVSGTGPWGSHDDVVWNDGNHEWEKS